MKRTSLYDKHLALGAKIVPFAGFEMPVQYSGIVDEHQTVRNAVGAFDVSHMGEFIVEGPRAQDFLQYITTNDVSQLADGKIQYSCMPNENGGIVDDLLIYKLADNKYMLVVNAGNIDKDWAWIERHNEKFGCEITDASARMSLIAVQGPKATAALQKLTDVKLADIPYYHFTRDTFAGINGILISATGYTGAGGFEIYTKNEDAPAVWDAIMKAGEEFGIKPAGLGCRDTLRLEMGFCLYGNDIDENTSPIAAGLGWITKFTKDFISKEKFEAEKQNGSPRKLTGLQLGEKMIPRQGYEVTSEDGTVVGQVTSGTMSPSMGYPIALAYIDKEYTKPGTKLNVSIRNKPAAATVVKLPFYKA